MGPRIAAGIKDDIFRGVLLPREPLIEAELARKYGVSKTPVREALSSLVRAGLVDFDPFRGARVRDFTGDDVREIYEMRILLEPFALRKAVSRMGDEDRGLLFALLDDADAAAGAEDLYVLSGLNRRFHDALIARCGNGRIIDTMRQIHDQLRAVAVRSWMHMPTYLREAGEHRRVAEAVASGDAGGAADLLREHIVGFEEQFVRAFGHRSPQEEIGN